LIGSTRCYELGKDRVRHARFGPKADIISAEDAKAAVLVAQSFMKVSGLNALAPTQSEPPFAITQGVVLVIFIIIAFIAVVRFRPIAAVRA